MKYFIGTTLLSTNRVAQFWSFFWCWAQVETHHDAIQAWTRVLSTKPPKTRIVHPQMDEAQLRTWKKRMNDGWCCGWEAGRRCGGNRRQRREKKGESLRAKRKLFVSFPSPSYSPLRASTPIETLAPSLGFHAPILLGNFSMLFSSRHDAAG